MGKDNLHPDWYYRLLIKVEDRLNTEFRPGDVLTETQLDELIGNDELTRSEIKESLKRGTLVYFEGDELEGGRYLLPERELPWVDSGRGTSADREYQRNISQNRPKGRKLPPWEEWRWD
ncbi:MAG: hypothetical protein HYS86_02835 [Candidatus Chisholmbacteria bacterium]|nr:hypothetical protein [Candidatus Chisholmbacteria bacterium]